MLPARSSHAKPEAVQDRLARLLGASPDHAPVPAPPENPAAGPPAPHAPDVSAGAPPSPAHQEVAAAAATPTRAPSRLSDRVRGRVAAAFGLRGARIDPGGAGGRSLAAVAVLVVVLAAAVAWWSAPRPEPVPSPIASPPPVQPSATGIVVAVAGKVRRPGLVTLPAGARVADAIEAAGGVETGTDIGHLNRARKVTDGELIVVGEPRPGAPGGTVPPGAPAKINLNTATLQQLDGLPGVGPVLARRILDYRDRHGRFRSVDELRKVDGIGPARYQELKDRVTV